MRRNTALKLAILRAFHAPFWLAVSPSERGGGRWRLSIGMVARFLHGAGAWFSSRGRGKLFLRVLGRLGAGALIGGLTAARPVLSQTHSYTVGLSPGYNSLAVHVLQGGNALNRILPSAPEGTRIYQWNPASQSFFSPAVFQEGEGWVSSATEALTLWPGNGAFIHLDIGCMVTFSGVLATSELRRGLVAPGYNFLSGPTPKACGFEELTGLPPRVGDRVYEFEQPFPGPLNQPGSVLASASSVHRYGTAGWDQPPLLNVGRSAFVFLSGFPRITRQPADSTSLAGQEAQLVVQAIGAAPLSYQWRAGSEALPGANAPSLRLPNVSPANAGFYSVVVSNATGSATSRVALLRVLLPPAIVQPPKSTVAAIGGTATFSVQAAGTPPLRYQWHFNGKPINGAMQAALELPDLKLAHAGAYGVLVTNVAGTAASQPATLAVEEPPTILEHPVAQTVPPGENVAFFVEAKGTPPLRYQWRLNGLNIPGETNSFLIRTKVQPEESGSYQVTVFNRVGAVDSAEALLTVILPALPVEDRFPPREIVTAPAFLGRASNRDATSEPGEPTPTGRRGQHSVWLTWRAPGRGIVTVRTRGSTFDTLLGAYDGPTLKELVPVDSDDDSAGFYASRIRFNTEEGQLYHFLVDGLNGEQGDIVLGWNFEPAQELLPVIHIQPQNQVVGLQQGATFFVEAGGFNLGYQWFFNGELLPQAFEPVLSIPEVKLGHLGLYRVRVIQGRQFVDSQPASLQFSLLGRNRQPGDLFLADKFADLLFPPEPRAGGREEAGAAQGIPSPVLGYTGSQIFNTFGSGNERGEVFHCGVRGGASQWFAFVPPATGRLYLNTAGSNFDTLLAVYTGSGASLTNLTLVACDNDSGPAGTSSLECPVTMGRIQYIVVDGVEGAIGTAHLNYSLLQPLVLTNAASTGTNGIRFRVLSTPATDFTIESSSNSVDWVSLLTTNTSTGIHDFRHTNSAGREWLYRGTQAPF